MTLQKGTADERVISYTYDEANRPKTITSNSGIFTYGYDAQGRRNSTTYPNGISTTYSYDILNRLTEIKHANGATPIAFASYSDFDNIGNRKNKTTPAGTEQYSYDDIYRLKQAVTPKGTENYSYDAVGNRTAGPGPKDTKYQYNAGNQQTIGRIFGHDYDNNGNRTTNTTPNATDKSWVNSWDYENRLIKSEQVKGAEKRTVTFNYDPQGRRIQKQLTTAIKGITKTTTWQYFYDNDNIVLEILTKPDTTTEKTYFTHGAGTDEHLALERSGQNYFYHADGLGSITAITDTAKNVVQTYGYDSFGNLRPSVAFRNSFTYTGREFDPEAGLYYYRARFYDAQDGRFVSRDPISFAGGDVNLYGYVENNPINWLDPSGLSRYSDMIDEARKCNLSDSEQRKLTQDFLDNLLPTGFTKRMLSSSEIIAKGRNIRKVEELVEKFGGKAKDWLKKKGWDEAGKEWHWYENQGQRVGKKPAGQPDPF